METTDAPGPETPDATPDSAAVVAARLVSLDERMAQLDERARHREAVIDRLHAENQELRAGERRSVLDPVIADLIRLHEHLGDEARRLGDQAQDRTATLLESLADDALLALERVGVMPLEARPGDPFRGDLHQPLSTVDAPDPAQADTIARVVSQGFRDAATGRVRRRVRAHFYRNAAPATATRP